jgi:hypothetical protein
MTFGPVIPRGTGTGNKCLAAALALIIFVCGGATGFAVAMMRLRPPPSMMMMAPDPPVEDLVTRLRVELMLSDEQAKRVEQIYQDRHDALRDIRQTMEPKLKAEYDKLDDQMKGVLNAEQYQRWSERFKNVRNRMLPPPGGPGFRRGPGGPDGMGPDGMGPGGPRRGGPGFDGPPPGGGPDGGPGDRPMRGPPGGGPPPP